MIRPCFPVLSIFLLIPSTAMAAAGPASSTPSSAISYLDTAIDTIRDNALYRSHVDWDKVRAEAHRRAKHAKSPAATYPAIRYVLNELGDHHSFLQLDDAHHAAESKALGKRYEHDSLDAKSSRKISTIYRGRKPEFSVLNVTGHGVLGYVVMPDTKPGQRNDAFSVDYQNDLRKLQKTAPCGWIVDLRGNDGGNVFPMIAGLGPLLGIGVVAGDVDRRGETAYFIYDDGRAMYRDSTGKDVVAGEVAQPLPPIRPAPPIAVLVDSLTASSGEILAIALQDRHAATTRYFGEHTLGLTTATAGHLLPDGANLVIAEGVDVSRDGRRYPDGIQPDVAIPDATVRPALGEDGAVQAATHWLSAQATCHAQDVPN